MSDFALRTIPARSGGLRSLLDWLRQARVAAHLDDQPTKSPDAAFLADVGLSAEQIGLAVDRGNVEIGLLGLGWQQPCRGVRR
jgi:hypothetical protein